MPKFDLKKQKIFSVKNFSFIIGLLVFLFIILIKIPLPLLDNLELKMMDIHFRWKTAYTGERKNEGVTQFQRNPNINPNIVIVGIDKKTLDQYGKWPFSRDHHADLVNAFTRITDQNQRESGLFLDIFFIEKASNPENDILLINAIKENDRVSLETVLARTPSLQISEDQIVQRQLALFKNSGEIKNIKGDTNEMETYYSAEPPVLSYAQAIEHYGHANFYEDKDDIYRRQQLVAKYSVFQDEIYLHELTPDYPINKELFERLEWVDRRGEPHTIDWPMSEKELNNLVSEIQAKAPSKIVNENGEQKEFYIIRKYKDHFVPAITLSLALQYVNGNLDDIEVSIGEYIRIPDPKKFNTVSGEWEPYVLRGQTKSEIFIPINEKGEMVVNFMGVGSSATRGGYQTYPVRSYMDYAEKAPDVNEQNWPRTLGVANKIIMVGAFAQGLDQKPTPVGLMYGIEIHANALNTILMNNFIKELPVTLNLLIALILIMLVSFYSSRMNTGWALLITAVLIVILLIGTNLLFEFKNVLFEFVTLGSSTILTFVSIVVYRVFMEESDKKRIKSMFGKYVSPVVVEQMLTKPPELGGVDSDITIFFSDIRSFTTLSESMTPQELVALLNEYLTAMTDTLISFNGTLDKYIGDAIMCFWGAPLPQEDHAELACKCALKQMEILEKMNSQWPESKRIQIGIGLNSGISTVGNMGSLGRMNYTAMGDNVNLASRLEAINKQYQTRIIISEYTYEKIAGKGFIVRELDDIRVKGKRKPVLIYELVGHKEEIIVPVKDIRNA